MIPRWLFLIFHVSLITTLAFMISYCFPLKSSDYSYAYGNTVDDTSRRIALRTTQTDSSFDTVNNSNTNFSSPKPTESALSLLEIFNKVRESVVQIKVTIPIINPQITIKGTPLVTIEEQYGSGFVYDAAGHIVTNSHVIEGASVIDVRFLNGNSYSANVTGNDIYSDLAVVKLDNSALSKQNLKPLSLSNSSLQIGQPVVAIGNPLGLTGSMTQGIISQVNRVQPDVNTGRFFVSGLIQTDAQITHGNSGGPLLDLKGQVVGVTERGILSEEFPTITQPGFNFAISSDTIKKVVPQLISNKSYSHPWLGLHVIDVSQGIAQKLGRSEARGIIVLDVTPGSPADLAGITEGTNSTIVNYQQFNSDADIIVAADDKPVRERSDLINYIDGKKSPGDTIKLKLVRNDKNTHDIEVVLGKRPDLNSP